MNANRTVTFHLHAPEATAVTVSGDFTQTPALPGIPGRTSAGRMGVLVARAGVDGSDRRPDGPMLEGVCIAYDAAIACYETIKAQGRFIAKKILNPATNKLVVVDVKPHPAVRQRNQALALMKSFCSEFGLSPVSRIRLASGRTQDDGEADLMELLARPRGKRTVVQ